MSPRLLVIGANGFVGAHLVNAAGKRFECIAAGRKECDITDAASVARAFAEARPQAVALVAAMADIDRCQREPARARETNVEGTRHVAEECLRSGARLLFVSSGAVFDGTRQEYREDAGPNPVGVYGASKAAAEAVVTKLLPDAIIARISLVLGFPLRTCTNSLLERMQSTLQSGSTVHTPADEYRNAIDVETVTRWMVDLLAAPESRGIFHLGSTDALSRDEIARGVAQAMGYPAELVVADDSPPPGRAPRGRYELLVPARIGGFSDVPAPTCRQAIERCVHAVT